MKFITIDEVATVVRGSSPRPQGDVRYYGGNVPRLMVSDVTRDGMYVTPNIDFLTEEGATKSRPMKKGDFIIAVSGDPGEPCILTVDACIHDGFVGFRNLDVSKVFTPYLYRFFKYNKLKSKSQAVGAIYKNLNTDQIKGIQIPLPPLPQQQKIANILDAADALRQNDKALIAKYDELTQALFLDMFGDPVSNPKGWEKVELKKLGKVITGSTPPSSKENMFGGNIPFVTPGDLDKNQPYKRFVTKEGALNSRTVEKGSLFVCCIGATIGKTGIARELSSFNQQINAVEWYNNINFQFGFNCFASLKKELIEKAISTTLPIMKKSEFEKLKMICPPVELQNQFAERVAVIEEQKAIAQKSLEHSESLFNSLLQKAFKGELV